MTGHGGGGISEHRMHIHNDGNIVMDTALRIGEAEGIDLPRATLDVIGEIWTTEGIQINGTKLSKQENGALNIASDLVVTGTDQSISIDALYKKVIELEQEIERLKTTITA